MRVSTYILMLLLVSQPASAIGGAWQAGQADAAATTVEQSAHCEDAGHERSEQAPASQTDCGTSCDICAACAAVVFTELQLSKQLIPMQAVLRYQVLLPPGTTRLPFRPPIYS